jgi:hypothetical protein
MTLPLVVLIGAPDWAQSLEQTLTKGWRIQHETEPNGYLSRLADARPALIVIDGADPLWRYWITTPKTSPAARRIPLIFITDVPETRQAALLAGADVVLGQTEFQTRAAQIVAEYARQLDPVLMQQLDCECQQPLPPLAAQGVAKFNAGEYYPQHDLFEAQWVETPGPVRDLYRAILQVGVAYYQIERGNHRGALKMLLRSLQWLAILPDVCQGIDVRQLREDSARVRAELERLAPQHIAAFDRRLLKPLRLVQPPAPP